MVGWHHRIDGHEFEQDLGVSDGQGSLVCYSPRGHNELDMTEQLNWIDGTNWPIWIRKMKNVKLDPYFEWKWMHSVVSDSLRPHGLYSPWNSLGQNTGVGSLSFLQGIFPTQVSCITGRFFTSWTTREALCILPHTQNVHSGWTKDQNWNSKM